MIKNLTLIFLLSIFFGSGIFGQTENSGKEVKAIEEYAGAIDKFVEKESSPHLVFADFSDYNEESRKPLWKKFASETEFEKYREKNETYTIAYVWRKNEKTVAANVSFSSPSGDWTQFVLYIFREDGSLAKIDSTLNTFYGDATVLRSIYFDAKGKKLTETVKYRDLQSEEEFDPKTRDFFDREVEIYKSVAELPFSALLKTPVKKK